MEHETLNEIKQRLDTELVEFTIEFLNLIFGIDDESITFWDKVLIV